MSDRKKILIVGGVAGGASAAARLRRLDENAELKIGERGGVQVDEYLQTSDPHIYAVGDVIEVD